MHLLARITSLASIPSPSSDSFTLGPLTFRAYGLMIALGVFAAIWLAGRRMKARGIHPDVASQLAIGGVIGGIIGSRLYHVITDWKSFQGRWGDAWKIWEGGLGIPGGIALGVVGAVLVAKRRGYPLPPLFDTVAPALPLAQAIGRLGNWFNQELFGRPTDLPWGLEIDPRNRPLEYVESSTFHPTFAYEALWNIGLMFFLIWLDNKRKLRTGRLFFVYMAGYAIGRLWIEAMRSDPAYKVFGLRVNIWSMGIVLLAGLAGLYFSGKRREGEDLLGRVPGDDGYGVTGATDIGADEDLRSKKTANTDKAADKAAKTEKAAEKAAKPEKTEKVSTGVAAGAAGVVAAGGKAKDEVEKTSKAVKAGVDQKNLTDEDTSGDEEE